MNADDFSYDGRSAKPGNDGLSWFHDFCGVANIATLVKRHVAKRETDNVATARYAFRMLSRRMILARWVFDVIMQTPRMTQAKLARELTDRLGRSIDRAAVNKMVKGTRKVAGDEMLAIEEITGIPAPAEAGPLAVISMPLVSVVDAGPLRVPDPVLEGAIGERIHVADLPQGDWIALTVEGDSMNLVAPEDSIICVNRNEREPVSGGFYVVADVDEGQTTFKRYRASPRQLEPLSTNRAHEPIPIDNDPHIIGRVRRVILDL